MSRQTPHKSRDRTSSGAAGGSSGNGHGNGHRRQSSRQQHQQNRHLATAHDANYSYDNTTPVGGDRSASGGTSIGDFSQQVHGGTESLDDMNLHVLQRYEPTIRSITARAASTVVYVLNYETGGWEKPDPPVEGTLFLCEQEPLAVDQYVVPRACVFLLNRKSLMNVVVDLARVNVAEVTKDLITLRIDDGAEGGGAAADEPGGGAETPPVLGLWIHNGSGNNNDGSTMPPFDANLVVQRWQDIRTALEQTLGTADVVETGAFLDAAAMISKVNAEARGLDANGIATTAIGPQPGIKDLVAMALGGPGGGQTGTVT